MNEANPGHPRGLYTLFLTEMWERFSYYGMRALLVLFMIDAVRGGMGMTDEVAAAVLYFIAAFGFFGLDREEKRRVAVIAVLFVASAMFWAGFEQAGSSLSLFAER